VSDPLLLVPCFREAVDPLRKIEQGSVSNEQHKHVLDAVRNLLPQLPEHHRPNFRPMVSEVDIGSGATREDPAYMMTREGFVLLVMGFTGKTALQFKVAYIDAFQAMEAEIQKRQGVPDPAQVMRQICPRPPFESNSVRSQRLVKYLRGLAAYWALLEDMPQHYPAEFSTGGLHPSGNRRSAAPDVPSRR